MIFCPCLILKTLSKKNVTQRLKQVSNSTYLVFNNWFLAVCKVECWNVVSSSFTKPLKLILLMVLIIAHELIHGLYR